MPQFKRVAAAVMLTLVTACSNGSQAVVPQVSEPNTVPPQSAAVRLDASQKQAKISVTVHWPRHQVKTRQHPRYVSPSTMSVVVSTSPAAGGATITALANNNGQVASTLTFMAPVGIDDFVATLYDKHQRAGTPQQGAEVGQGERTLRVKAGIVNTVTFTIDGIIAKLGFTLAANQPMAAISGDAGDQTLTMVGDPSETIVVSPMDADGNVIVAPGVVPAVSMSVGNESAGAVTVSPAGGSANRFVVSVVEPSIIGSYGLIATAADGRGNSATTNLALVQSSAIYVGYGSGSGAKIAAYDSAGDRIALPATAFKGVTQPVALTYDTDDHELFVADRSGKIFAFDGAGSPITSFKAAKIAGITSISYFNATCNTNYCNGSVIYPAQLTNPKRILVGSSAGLSELSLAGQVISQAATPFTPTAVAGMFDAQYWTFPDGWLILAGDPTGQSVDPYDLVTLAPVSGNNFSLNGDVAAGLTAYPLALSNAGGGWTSDACLYDFSSDAGIDVFDMCLYAVTGSTSHIDELADLNPLPATGQTATTAGTLAAAAVDPLTFQIDVVQSDKNAIAKFGAAVGGVVGGYQLSSFKAAPEGSITTPSSSGLSNPDSIAVQW